jgi:hypothetical protein
LLFKGHNNNGQRKIEVHGVRYYYKCLFVEEMTKFKKGEGPFRKCPVAVTFVWYMTVDSFYDEKQH